MIITFCVGAFAIGIFILVKSGLLKSWWIVKTLPGILSPRMVYATIPVGLGFILLSILPSLDNYNSSEFPFTLLLGIAVFGGPLVGFLLMYRPPKWLDPKWLQWLKSEYGYCLDILIEDAQQMNRWDWERQVRTRAGMQQWIDGIYEQHQEDIDFYWQYEKFTRVRAQLIKRKKYSIHAGMKVEGTIPAHRQGDDVLVREEIDAVVAVRNAMLLEHIEGKD